MPITTVAEVDLSAIRENMMAIRERVGPKVKIMPAVKAGAYGHGAVPISRECVASGAEALGVASVEEALELRQAGIRADILILGCAPSDAAPEIVRWDIAATTCESTLAEALSGEAVRQNKPARVHLKIDTGMGRIGVPPGEAAEFAGLTRKLPGIRIEGVFTHFASSDEVDPEFTQSQIDTFRRILGKLNASGLNGLLAHCSNSGGILAYPEADFDAVRPGIMLYGHYPSEQVPRTVRIREALTLKTRIAFVKTADPGCSISYGRTHTLKRKSLIATLPIGYEDGYSRRLSNTGEVVVRGVRVPVVGRVCMDQTMIDVTDVPGVRAGDEVILYGGGYDFLSVSRIAEMIGTIPHEVLCNLGRRVPRVYVNGSKR
jgi:alanine racemase